MKAMNQKCETRTIVLTALLLLAAGCGGKEQSSEVESNHHNPLFDLSLNCQAVIKATLPSFSEASGMGFSSIERVEQLSVAGLIENIRLFTKNDSGRAVSYDLNIFNNIGDDTCNIRKLSVAGFSVPADFRSANENVTGSCRSKLNLFLKAYVEADWDFNSVESIKVTGKSHGISQMDAAVMDNGHDIGEYRMMIGPNCKLQSVEQTVTFTP